MNLTLTLTSVSVSIVSVDISSRQRLPESSTSVAKKTYHKCITGYAHNTILQRANHFPFLPSPMHRSYYTIPPTWPPLSPTPRPVCSQPHQVSRLAAPKVTASVLYSSVSFHACCNLHYQSLCHCCNFQSVLLILFSLSKTWAKLNYVYYIVACIAEYYLHSVYTCNPKGTAHALCTSTGVCAVRRYAWSGLETKLTSFGAILGYIF